MICPSCQAVVRKRSNFCAHCGHQMPVMVGVHYPFGIRFPASGFGPEFAAAVMQARRAPRYHVDAIEGARFHVALYDRTTVSDLAKLHRMVFSALPGQEPLIEHTTDGRSFFSGPSFWGCFAKRLAGTGVDFPEVAHCDARCHSYFGCVAAQKRQHEMYHREGWELFYNGRHGIFPGGDDADGVLALDDIDRSRFILDRDKVKAEVMNLFRRAGTNRCPLFSQSHLEQQVRKLPSVVFVGDPGWRFVDCAIHGPAVAFECYGG